MFKKNRTYRTNRTYRSHMSCLLFYYNRKKLILGFIIFLLFIAYCPAFSINIGERIDIPKIGLSLKLFRKMENRPLMPPGAYRTKVGNKTVYSDYDIWFYKQFLGKWANEYSEVTIAFMGISPDTITSKRYITEEEINTGLKLNAASSAWTESKTNDWINLYFKQKFSEKISTKNLSANRPMGIYYLDYSNFKYILALVKDKKGTGQNVVILYKFAGSVSKRNAVQAAYRSINTIRFINIDNKGDVENNLQKELLLNSVRNYKDWSILETDDYYIVTNCDVKSKHDYFIKLIVTTLGKEQLIYCFFIKNQSTKKDKFVVRIFNDRDGYIAYVGKKYEWTAGMWMPSKKELVLTKSNYKSSERKQFLETLKHEAFHQYIDAAFGRTLTGAWYNEGYAVFFQNVYLFGDKIHVKPDKNKLDFLKQNLDSDSLANDIAALLKMNYAEFYSIGKSKYNYTLAWAVIYYLNTGSDLTYRARKRDYSKILSTYYNQLEETGNNSKATDTAWKNINLKHFAEDLTWFYKTKVTSGKTVVFKIN